MTKVSPVELHSIEKARQNLERTTVISVTVSKHLYLTSLPGVSKDRGIIRQLFVDRQNFGIYDKNQFIELADPTLDVVRSRLIQYMDSRSARGDILIFYFSGHGCVVGANDFGFCLADSMLGMEESGILPLSVLSFRSVIQTLATADIHPVFIIDACFSGAVVKAAGLDISVSMQDDLHTYVTGSYGLLCSSSSETLSVGSNSGSAFTQALFSVISEGLSDKQQRHWPFITLSGVATPLRERLERDGVPLSRCYSGPQLPEVPIARNISFRPSKERFSPYMKRIVSYLWNNGSVREVIVDDLGRLVGKGAYGNHSKLSLKPWGLLEDGTKPKTRRLTRKGKLFAQGQRSIPRLIMKDPVSWEWIPAADTDRIKITDIKDRYGKPQKK
ncbi:MAG TPA: caspase family protein [Anaerolineales bacterium]|nr:caspase family protein [Anaerolineales bacterium]